MLSEPIQRRVDALLAEANGASGESSFEAREPVALKCLDREQVQRTSVGEATLKGFDEPVALYEVRARG